MVSRLTSRDTDFEAAQIQIEAFRRLEGAQRLAMALELSYEVRALVAAGIRDRHPEYDDVEVELAVRLVFWGRELFRRIYPGKVIRS